MRTLHPNTKGFSAIEALLILVVVAVLAGAGWYIWHRERNMKTASNSTSSSNHPTPSPTPDPYAGWKVYSNSQVSFKYPSDWTTGVMHYTIATATSPTFLSSAVATADNPNAPIHLFLQLSTNGNTIDCADAPCQVSTVVPLSNSQLPGAVLAVVNQTSGNGTKFTEYVVASGSTKAGDSSVTAVKAGSNAIYVFGQPAYNTGGSGPLAVEAARVTDVAAFQSDSHVKDLVKLINSIQFN